MSIETVLPLGRVVAVDTVEWVARDERLTRMGAGNVLVGRRHSFVRIRTIRTKCTISFLNFVHANDVRLQGVFNVGRIIAFGAFERFVGDRLTARMRLSDVAVSAAYSTVRIDTVRTIDRDVQGARFAFAGHHVAARVTFQNVTIDIGTLEHGRVWWTMRAINGARRRVPR